MTQKEISTRQNAPLKETWDISKLYKNFDAWESDFAALPTPEELNTHLNKTYVNKLSSSPKTIANALSEYHILARKLMNLYTYAGLKNTEDVGEPIANNAKSKMNTKYSELMAAWSFLNPELLQIKELNSWLVPESSCRDELKPYYYELKELIRSKKHILSSAEENILAQLGSVFTHNGEIHSQWSNVDTVFPSATDALGNKHILTNGRYGLLMNSSDRTLRKSAWENYNQEISKHRNTIASNFYAHLSNCSIRAKIKKFSSFLESELFADDIPTSLYNNLIAQVRTQLPLLHRSMHLRAKILEIQNEKKETRVFPYDRVVSLVHGNKFSQRVLKKAQNQKLYSWVEACELVLNACKPLGEEYCAVARKGLLEERWADYTENVGKRSGAFSWGTYDSNPVMMITWTGTLNDVFTLAHELGHSMHSYFSNKNQPYHLSSYTIFVAEVASTLNEALLSDYLLNSNPTEQLAGEVLSQGLEGFEGTVLRQLMFATFERDTSQKVDSGEALSANDFDSIYDSLSKEWFGNSMEHLPLQKHEWMRIPHFYNTFYVYKYATSYCASAALCERLIKKPSETATVILNLLKSGGSKSPLAQMLDAGVDFIHGTPVQDAFKIYEQRIEAAEKLFLAAE
jgi:oligoendopeptidase F